MRLWKSVTTVKIQQGQVDYKSNTVYKWKMKEISNKFEIWK